MYFHMLQQKEKKSYIWQCSLEKQHQENVCMCVCICLSTYLSSACPSVHPPTFLSPYQEGETEGK